MNRDNKVADAKDDDIAAAIASANDLINRLVDDCDGDAAVTLRKTQEVLARLRPTPTATDAAAQRDTPATLLLDVSDLLGYFENNRLPTGIQRVQAELIFNIIGSSLVKTSLCCFIEAQSRWVAVEVDKFMNVCVQSRAGGDPLDPRWLSSVRDLNECIVNSPTINFGEGAILVNLGTSWWLPNYFLHVRHAKIKAKIRYVPLVYDLIPIITPENCDPALTREFIEWFISVLDHADFFLAISEATRRDLISFSKQLGRPVSLDRVAVVPLDADFRAAESRPLPSSRRFSEPFVLFVSTLEARKNQTGAMDAWASLIVKYGAEKVPRLVFVGKRGFKSDAILERMEKNTDLAGRVTILAGIEDIELQALYRDCLFTIYPSFYEGWGLPVTESLCYAKVPLIADNSSLPEAGGDFAVYFPTGSITALMAAMERLVFDTDFRTGLEQKIRRDFKPRTWRSLAVGASEQIRRWAEAAPPVWRAPPVMPGSYYPLIRNRSSQIWPGKGSAEQFRHGTGWFKVEDNGCWTHQSGGELEMRLSVPSIRRIGFEIFCAHRYTIRYRISLVGVDAASVEGYIKEDGFTWAFLDLPVFPQDATVCVRLKSTILSQPELGSNGDFRRLGLGLRGFYIFDDNPSSKLNFLEAVALGSMPDQDYYRDRSLEL